MTPLTFIFFGPTGSGKGTQAKLLIERLKEKDPDKEVLYVETGQKFREFILGESYTSKLTKDILEVGGLLPEFLPIWIWTEYFIRHVSGNEHLILDGLSRRVEEAPVLDSAMKFYNRVSPFVISIELSKETVTQRIYNRKREDDNKLDVKAKLEWYEKNVIPAIEYFKTNPYYKFISINGEGSIEEVNKEIMVKVGLQ